PRREAWVESIRHMLPRPGGPPPAPIEPAELSSRFPEELGETAQTWPLVAAADQTFLHAMRNDVANSLEDRAFIEARRGQRLAPPEGTPPVHESSDFLRRVREEVLHELREVPPGRSQQQMQVIRGKGESEELHPEVPHRPGKYAAEDVVRPRGRTE